ncbi:MAG: gliding motility protein GldM [Bacteroidetes bacterium]|nr:MAG: gliding motility protein GldM [Bacteroidota bacterium]MBL1145936.1 gliding motility protein GldM [Bacteroidota bacterium]NOG58730.1 gliding motility protein GldM [Bacteroidota bacterium]
MAGGKLPPRQKMIGMMYLVLTALLAMNVSKDILNAFVTVNDGLERTKNNFRAKNQDQYNDFASAYSENKVKVGPYWTKAQEVQKRADELVKYIDDIKVEIIGGIEHTIPKDQIRGKDENGVDTILNMMQVKVKDNYIFSTALLVGPEPGSPKDGEYSAIELKTKLEALREDLKGNVAKDGSIYRSLDKTFSFEDKKNASGVVENWPAYNFYGVPAAATLTLLTKIQTDVRNAESDVIKYLYSQVDAASYKFNVLESAVISPSNYVLVGDTFYAKVFLAAFDDTKNPEIFLGDTYDSISHEVGGNEIPVDIQLGKGYIKIPARSEGDFTYNGVIKYKGPSGEFNYYPFTTEYKVAKPSTTISATKMNVFYIGVDNPVDISAPGVAKDKIRPSISSGSISKASGGDWVVRVTSPGTAIIKVAAEVDGGSQNMGQMEFRVKKIPDPIGKIGGQTGGTIRKAQLQAAATVRAELENFDFDVKAEVVSYSISYVKRGLLATEDINGGNLTNLVKDVIRDARVGDRIYFDNIKARLPDGTTRTLPTVSFKLL